MGEIKIPTMKFLGAILTIYLQLSEVQACLRIGDKDDSKNGCSCPDGFKKASNKTGNTFDDNLCLFDNDSLVTYSEAKEECHMLNATLPILDSFEDLERFNSLINMDSWIGAEKKSGFFSKTWENCDGTSFNQELIGLSYKNTTMLFSNGSPDLQPATNIDVQSFYCMIDITEECITE